MRERRKSLSFWSCLIVALPATQVQAADAVDFASLPLCNPFKPMCSDGSFFLRSTVVDTDVDSLGLTSNRFAVKIRRWGPVLAEVRVSEISWGYYHQTCGDADSSYS